MLTQLSVTLDKYLKDYDFELTITITSKRK